MDSGRRAALPRRVVRLPLGRGVRRALPAVPLALPGRPVDALLPVVRFVFIVVMLSFQWCDLSLLPMVLLLSRFLSTAL